MFTLLSCPGVGASWNSSSICYSQGPSFIGDTSKLEQAESLKLMPTLHSWKAFLQTPTSVPNPGLLPGQSSRLVKKPPSQKDWECVSASHVCVLGQGQAREISFHLSQAHDVKSCCSLEPGNQGGALLLGNDHKNSTKRVSQLPLEQGRGTVSEVTLQRLQN